MIEAIVRLLRPIYVPILRLSLTAPHLPEGNTLVRHLTPSQSWLSYRYVNVMLGLLGQLVGVGVGMVLLVARLGGPGIALAALLGLVELFVLGFAFVTTRVDYELRHYLVGDRSLRVSMGAVTRREVTLSYANVQNLEVNQGPLERLFGFKSLTVSTAGGDANPLQKGADNLHVVTLVGLENADELRELVLGMLRQHRDSGLGEAPVKREGALDLKLLAEVRDAATALREAAGS